MLLNIPGHGLVLLMGAAGSGKSTFARKHFKNTEIVSSDWLRAAVSDDEADQSASADAFELVHLIAAKRLRRGKLTVIDATNVQPEARRRLLALAAKHSVPVTAIILNLPAATCLARNQGRVGRQVSPDVVQRQVADLQSSLPLLEREGVHKVYLLDNPEDIDSARILLQKT